MKYLSLLFLCTLALPVSAVGETGKLLSNDIAAGDYFGETLAMDGNTLVVGARQDNSASGAAYVFDSTTGLQLFKLLPNDPSFGKTFGLSVAISGNTIIIGAPRDGENGLGAGAAYLFDVTTGLQTAKLFPNDAAAGDFFGWTVVIEGNTALIGSRFGTGNTPQSGAAYVFDLSTGMQTAKLFSDDGAPFDQFSWAMAFDGDTAIFGAYGDDDFFFASGSAYVFDLSTGTQLFKLRAPDPDDTDQFGITVAISGTTAVISCSFDDDKGFDCGAVYFFDTTTGLPTRKLFASDPAQQNYFGASLAIDGNTLVVGAVGVADNGKLSGATYIFDMTTGEELTKLLPTDGAAFDQFGIWTAIEDNRLFIGAFLSDTVGSNSGSVYVFDISLTSNSSTISLSAGGEQALAMTGGASRAGWFYFMFGSVTGTTPGIDFGGGVVLPLNFDAYFSLTLTKPGLGAFGNFRGVLDGNGQAAARLTLPALMDPSLVGLTLNHAYVAASVFGIPEFASGAVSVTLL